MRQLIGALLCLLPYAAWSEDLADPKSRVFFEDFSNGFDQSPDGGRRWMTAFPFGFHQARTLAGNNEAECYTDTTTGTDPFSLSHPSGNAPYLTITAAASSANPCRLPYTSGVITTFGSFRMLYGYVEARLALPQGAGLWPGFWMLPADNQGRAELDILETWGFDPAAYYATSIAQFDGINDQTRIPLDDQKRFHTYGVDWEADRIVWYLDGTRVKIAPTPASMHTPMYILLNLAVYGPGSFQAEQEQRMAKAPPANFPAGMTVTRISAYRTEGTMMAGPPTQSVHIPPVAE